MHRRYNYRIQGGKVRGQTSARRFFRESGKRPESSSSSSSSPSNRYRSTTERTKRVSARIPGGKPRGGLPVSSSRMFAACNPIGNLPSRVSLRSAMQCYRTDRARPVTDTCDAVNDPTRNEPRAQSTCTYFDAFLSGASRKCERTFKTPGPNTSDSVALFFLAMAKCHTRLSN